MSLHELAYPLPPVEPPRPLGAGRQGVEANVEANIPSHGGKPNQGNLFLNHTTLCE